MLRHSFSRHLLLPQALVALWVLLGALWIPVAAAAETISLQRGEPLTLRFDAPLAELDHTGNASRAVLLNGYDITAFATLATDTVRITLDSPLQQGDYVVAVQQIDAQGQALLLFERLISLSLIETSASGSLLGNYFHRATESDREDFAGTVRSLSEAALRLQASRGSATSSITASADVQYRSDAQTNLNGTEFELPNYLVEAQRTVGSSELTLAVGHQNIGSESLVFHQFHRRGISAGLATGDGSGSFSVFSSSSEPTVSYSDNLVVPGSREERSSGANLRFSPISDKPEALQIFAGYIDGESQLVGTGINFETGLFETQQTAYGGKTWNVGLASQWRNGALALRAQYAGSDFDADGFDVGEASRSDSAYSVSITLDNRGDFPPGLAQQLGIDQWRIALRSQTVGPDFYSLANITLPGDLSTHALDVELVRGSFRINSGWLTTQNNVDDRADIPDQKLTNAHFNLQYSPVMREPVAGPWSWLGTPTVGVSLARNTRWQPLEDAMLFGQVLDDETLDYGLRLDFQHQRYQWHAQYSAVDYNNAQRGDSVSGFYLAPPRSDSQNRFATLQVSYRAAAQFSLSPTLQWSRYEERDSNNTQEALNLGLQTSLSLFDNRLTLDVNYASNEQKNATYYDGLFLQRTDAAQFDALVTWRAVTPRGRRPGVNFSLRGNWNLYRSNVQNNNEAYQVLLGIQIDWRSDS